MTRPKYKKCVYCGTNLKGQQELFCSASHKSMYYEKKKVEKRMEQDPDDYVKDLLEKTLVTRSEKIPFLPRQNRGVISQQIWELLDSMEEGEIRKIVFAGENSQKKSYRLSTRIRQTLLNKAKVYTSKGTLYIEKKIRKPTEEEVTENGKKS